jgi:hypothetical protein
MRVLNEKDFNQTKMRKEKEYSLDEMSLHSLMCFTKLTALMRLSYLFSLLSIDIDRISSPD